MNENFINYFLLDGGIYELCCSFISFLGRSYKFIISLFFIVDLIDMVDEEKRLNATYIISVARKLGCSIFLLPEDIMEVWMLLYLDLAFGFLQTAVIQFDDHSFRDNLAGKSEDDPHSNC